MLHGLIQAQSLNEQHNQNRQLLALLSLILIMLRQRLIGTCIHQVLIKSLMIINSAFIMCV